MQDSQLMLFRYSITIGVSAMLALLASAFWLAPGNANAATHFATVDPVTESFAQSAYTLTVSTVGTGTVTKQPDQTTYLQGTFVNLTATTIKGFIFRGWSGDCMGTGVCTVIMDSVKSVTATFTPISGPENDRPSFASTPAVHVSAGATYTYFVVATDPDTGDLLTISVTAKPTWLALTATANGTAILTGTPGWSDIGAHVMRLRVQDAYGAFATQEFILFVDPPDPAQPGSIQGMVLDAEGNGIGGAMVTLLAANDDVAVTDVQGQITNSNGSYIFEAVQQGDYTIAVSINGQAPAALAAVNVLPGQPATIPTITLQTRRPFLRLPLLYK